MESKQKIKFDPMITHETESLEWTYWDRNYKPVEYTDILKAVKRVREWQEDGDKDEERVKKNIKRKKKDWNPSKRYP